MIRIDKNDRREVDVDKNCRHKHLYVSTRLTGKMQGISAISTSRTVNDFCLKCSQKPTTVCAKCYAASAMKRYKAAKNQYENNAQMLSTTQLEDWQFPRTVPGIMRLETHGELINQQHLLNYVRLCEINPQTQFVLWTKRVDLIRKLAMNNIAKPQNMLVKISSPFLGQESKVNKTWYHQRGWDFTLFTVYSLQQIKKTGKTVDCGGRNCASCLQCYMKETQHDTIELLKQDQNKAIKQEVE